MPTVPADPWGEGTPQTIYWRYGAPGPDDPAAPIGGDAIVQMWTPAGPVVGLTEWVEGTDPNGGDPSQILRWAPFNVEGGYPVRLANLLSSATPIVRWGGRRLPAAQQSAPPAPRVMAYVSLTPRVVFAQVP